MKRRKIPAVFMRGGTSKGVFFKASDLPPSREERDVIFLKALGSPDRYHRQLNGMGGGLSSVSKAVVVEPSGRDDADVDYTFVQIAVDQPITDYRLACGNLSSAVGPFAVDEGLVSVEDGAVTVRVYSTNTNQIYHAHFHVEDGEALETGDYEMSGVDGRGARVQLDYLDPGGAITGAFLPTGHAVDVLELKSGQSIEASLIDATNPVVFIAAGAIGLSGTEAPETLEADTNLMGRLDDIRRAAGVIMGLAKQPEDVPLGNPKISILSAPSDYVTIGGEAIKAEDYDVAVRGISMERVHRALPGTGGMCLAAAAQVSGSLPHRLARCRDTGHDLRIATPSGVMTIAATAHQNTEGTWIADKITVYRTQRRLMEGNIVLPVT